MGCVLSLSRWCLFWFFLNTQRTLPGKSPLSVLEPCRRDTEFRLRVSILFLKSILFSARLPVQQARRPLAPQPAAFAKGYGGARRWLCSVIKQNSRRTFPRGGWLLNFVRGGADFFDSASRSQF